MRALVLLLIILLFGCMAAAGQVNTVTRGQDSLYRVKCAACHRLYQPKNYTYEKLQSYVTKYGKRLSAEERQRLLEYLKGNAKQK